MKRKIIDAYFVTIYQSFPKDSSSAFNHKRVVWYLSPVCRKTPAFRFGDIRRHSGKEQVNPLSKLRNK
jgi:hypothetical protein